MCVYALPPFSSLLHLPSLTSPHSLQHHTPQNHIPPQIRALAIRTLARCVGHAPARLLPLVRAVWVDLLDTVMTAMGGWLRARSQGEGASKERVERGGDGPTSKAKGAGEAGAPSSSAALAASSQAVRAFSCLHTCVSVGGTWRGCVVLRGRPRLRPTATHASTDSRHSQSSI